MEFLQELPGWGILLVNGAMILGIGAIALFVFGNRL